MVGTGVSSGSYRFTSCKQEEQPRCRVLAPAEGEGLEDGGGRTPTRDETALRPPSPAPQPSCPLRPWAAQLPRGLGTEPVLAGAGRATPVAPAPGAWAPSPGSGPGAPVHGHIGFLAPVTASARGRRERKWDARSRGSASSQEPKWPAGKAGGRGGNCRLPELVPVTPAGLGALPPRHTPPRLTTRKRPRRPRAAALVAPAPRAGRKGGDPGRAAGRGGEKKAAEGGGGQGGREGGGKMEPGPYLSTDCSFSSSFF